MRLYYRLELYNRPLNLNEDDKECVVFLYRPRIALALSLELDKTS